MSSAVAEDGIRVSLFVDPEEAADSLGGRDGADRVELYTEPFARAFEQGERPRKASFDSLCPRRAHWPIRSASASTPGTTSTSTTSQLFRRLPHLDEVSIGHALVSHALVRRPGTKRARVSGRPGGMNYDSIALVLDS